MIVIENTQVDTPKTKMITQFIKESGIQGRKILFLGEGKYEEASVGDKSFKVSVKTDAHANFAKSIRNIPKMHFALAKNISGYDIIYADDVVITESALNEIQEWLCGAKE